MALPAFSFLKIIVKDLAASERFYCDVIGFKVVERTSAPEGEFAQEELFLSSTGGEDATRLMLIRYLDRPAPPPGESWLGFVVADVAATTEAAVKAGGNELIVAHYIPAHKVSISVVSDPEGHVIELVEVHA